MPWKTPYGKGKYRELPLELKKFWIEVLSYSMDDIIENVVDPLPLKFKNLHHIEKQFLLEQVIDTLFGKENLEDENAYLDMAANIPFIMFQTYIDNDELSLSTLLHWIQLLILAWESLKITPEDDHIFDFYPLFRKRVILKMLKNSNNLNDFDQIKLVDILEPYKNDIQEHLSSYLDDIRDCLFWNEDWMIDMGWALKGDQLKSFLKQYDIYEYYYEKHFLLDGSNLYVICPCHKTKKKLYYNQLFNKICKLENMIKNIELEKERNILLEKFARQQASIVIQKMCHRWLWAPVCKDGSIGINVKLGWKCIVDEFKTNELP